MDTETIINTIKMYAHRNYTFHSGVAALCQAPQPDYTDTAGTLVEDLDALEAYMAMPEFGPAVLAIQIHIQSLIDRWFDKRGYESYARWDETKALKDHCLACRPNKTAGDGSAMINQRHLNQTSLAAKSFVEKTMKDPKGEEATLWVQAFTIPHEGRLRSPGSPRGPYPAAINLSPSEKEGRALQITDPEQAEHHRKAHYERLRKHIAFGEITAEEAKQRKMTYDQIKRRQSQHYEQAVLSKKSILDEQKTTNSMIKKYSYRWGQDYDDPGDPNPFPRSISPSPALLSERQIQSQLDRLRSQEPATPDGWVSEFSEVANNWLFHNEETGEIKKAGSDGNFPA